MNGQKAEDVVAYDLGFILRRHFSVDQGVVFGDEAW
jgi:hypothetical protein